MKALLLVDIQHDFLPTGALPVPDGDAVISVANRLIDQFDLVVATQDWHPANHGSFANNHDGHNVFEVINLNGLDQVLWPAHCVQGSHGAEFAEGLDNELINKTIQKGTNVGVDSYSGFADNGQRFETELNSYLQSQNVDTLYVLGLATDYCVKFTVLDALTRGYHVFLVVDGCRGVNQNPDDSENAVKEMVLAGAQVITSLDACS